MAKTWEDVTWEDSEPLKEWSVEYLVSINEDQHHHLSGASHHLHPERPATRAAHRDWQIWWSSFLRGTAGAGPLHLHRLVESTWPRAFGRTMVELSETSW